MENIVVVDCIRTGLAKAHRGTFNLTRSDDLVAHCINALLERNPQVDPASIEDVILGCGRQVGEQSANVARHAVALSNLPITVPATTISRACSAQATGAVKSRASGTVPRLVLTVWILTPSHPRRVTPKF